MEWTRQMEERAKQLFFDGRSAARVACALNRDAPGGMALSRNAVIGKLSRMGVKRGPNPPMIVSMDHPQPGVRFRPRSHRRAPVPVQLAPSPRQLIHGLQIHELTPDACAYPFGDPRADDFRYCGAIKPSRHHPYCAHHKALTSEPAKRAITPPQTQRGFNGSR